MSKGIKLLKGSRKIHAWFGITLGIFIAIEAVTALYLLHKKSFPTVEKTTLPWGISERKKMEPLPVKAIVSDPSRPKRQLLATHSGIIESTVDASGKRSDQWLSGDTAGKDIKALAFQGDRIWVGLGKQRGLLSCQASAEICQPVGNFREIQSLSVLQDGWLMVAVEKEGAYLFNPASGEKTQIVEAALMASPHAKPLTWGTLLLKLHTGEIVGGRLMLFWDLLSLALVAYVVTGIYIWLKPKLIKRSRQQAGAKA
ncbi:MAG: PepSY domain-containing protein [Deltaproteobacteria bacterium]|nr:PepSY domain-containing protein [Deltaproteobacteria bacterium]